MDAAEAALVAECHACPEADGPRLVYADWLEEHGEAERAELIRVQCARCLLAEAEPAWRALAAREAELVGRARGRWREAWGSLCHVTFDRGLAVAMALPADAFLARGPGPEPAVTPHLLLRSARGHVKELAAHPLLAQCARLDLSYNHLGPEGLAVLVASPVLANLRHLGLASNHLGGEGAAVLAGAPLLGQLHTLDLRLNRLFNPGVAALVGSPYLHGLRRLDLGGNRAGNEAARRLAATAGLAGLRQLDLCGNNLDATGAEALAASPLLTRLDLIDLRDNRIRLDDLAWLRQRHGGRLRL
jgi:uncharacterized protein (TIGR02996 family)